jgi:hypothetical protein
MSKRVIAGLIVMLALSCGLLATNSQQDKMKKCNQMASDKNMTGDQRKDFMSKCLSASEPPAEHNSQQEKMKACNKEASEKNLSGDARKTFMSSCLSSHPTAAPAH